MGLSEAYLNAGEHDAEEGEGIGGVRGIQGEDEAVEETKRCFKEGKYHQKEKPLRQNNF